MSPSRWRFLAIGLWVALACITFVWVGSVAARSWLLLVVGGVIPPAMLLWLWNEDGPQLLGTLRPGTGRR
jgi:hypothetical protein